MYQITIRETQLFYGGLIGISYMGVAKKSNINGVAYEQYIEKMNSCQRMCGQVRDWIQVCAKDTTHNMCLKQKLRDGQSRAHKGIRIMKEKQCSSLNRWWIIISIGKPRCSHTRNIKNTSNYLSCQPVILTMKENCEATLILTNSVNFRVELMHWQIIRRGYIHKKILQSISAKDSRNRSMRRANKSTSHSRTRTQLWREKWKSS